MLYFVLWAIFLMGVLLAIPIVVLIEKRRLRAEQPSVAEAEPSEDAISDDQESPLATDPLADNSVDGGGDPSTDRGAAVTDPDIADDEFADFEEL